MYERVRRTFGRRPRSLARSCRRLTLAPERSRLFERRALSDPRAGRRALLLRETVCRTWGSAAIGLALAGVRVLSRNGPLARTLRSPFRGDSYTQPGGATSGVTDRWYSVVT